MADDGLSIRTIDWRQVLPFTHLFRAFRIAIHPSKLLLGLALLLSVYAGGRIMDSLWPVRHLAVPEEVAAYQMADNVTDFQHALVDLPVDGRVGIFRELFFYQVSQFNGVVQSVLANNWAKTEDNPGVLGHFYNFLVVGPLWLGQVHPVFAIIFAAIFLGAWSLFGGAVSRLAAVHVARDEKISIRQALDFALGKFLSFASAPVIPLLILLAVGFLLSLGSLAVGNIPYIGPIVVGGAFFLALLAGFIQTLVILGSVGGFNLMYPTISVEGSDSFDAISRSFSYVYARPWRMVFYTAVAVAYGAVVYLFIRYFILLVLILAHHFVNLGMFAHDKFGGPLFSSMWPSPAGAGRLTYHINFDDLDWGGRVGAGLLSFWIYLMIGVMGSFAISFYFSANTIIYCLMRRELDATELDDVYLEQSDDELVAAAGEAVAVETIEVNGAQASSEPPAPAAS